MAPFRPIDPFEGWETGETGIAILSAHKILMVETDPLGDQWTDPQWSWCKSHFSDQMPKTKLLRAQFSLGEQELCIANTHGAWAPNAMEDEPLPHQSEQIGLIRDLMDSAPPTSVLCGDFNVNMGHRRRSQVKQFGQQFTSALPELTNTTIDPTHRANRPGFALNMVSDDQLFGPGLKVLNTVLVPGVSDHIAIVSTYGFAA